MSIYTNLHMAKVFFFSVLRNLKNDAFFWAQVGQKNPKIGPPKNKNPPGFQQRQE